MILYFGIIFFVSLAALVALFTQKLREIETSAVLMPGFKAAADKRALRLKELLFAATLDSKKLLPLLLYWGHVVVHALALQFAWSARAASRKSHQLADFVSHKRNFQPRQTRSEFLRKIGAWGREDTNGQRSEK